MTDTDIAANISNMFIEVKHLREKSDADERMIHLLKEQNRAQADEMVEMATNHADEVRTLKHRADVAMRNQAEVVGVLNTAAKGIMEGLRKMKGDNTPAIMPSAQARPADDPRLPPMDDDGLEIREIIERLPAIDFRNGARIQVAKQG